MNKETIVQILMDRDEMDREDAVELVDDTIEEINQAINEGRTSDVDDILACNLCLEPDYIWALI